MTDELAVAVMGGVAPAGWRYLAPSPQVATVQAPAAGSDWAWAAPAGRLVRPVSVVGKLAASTVAGSRVPSLKVVAPGGVLVAALPSDYHPAPGASAVYIWVRGLGYMPTATGYVAKSLGDMTLPPGCTIQVVTTNLQAGDQWSDVAVLFEAI